MSPVPLIASSRRPDITFCPDGRIDITARIAKSLNLQPGDVINIAFHNGEFLLYVMIRTANRVGKHSATVHPTNHGKRHNNNFRTYSKLLCQIISKEVYGSSNRKTRLPAGKPVTIGKETAVPLITRNPL